MSWSDWVKWQREDPVTGRVLELLRSGTCNAVIDEDRIVRKLLHGKLRKTPNRSQTIVSAAIRRYRRKPSTGVAKVIASNSLKRSP